MEENDNNDAPEISEVDSANPMLNEDENESKDTDMPSKYTLSINNIVDNPVLHNEDRNENEEKELSLHSTAFIDDIVDDSAASDENKYENKEKHFLLKQTASIDNTVDNPDKHEKSQNRHVIGSSVTNDLELDGKANIQVENEQVSITAAKLSEHEEKNKAKKVLWIPYKPVEDIQDYQSVFEPDSERSDDTYEEFLRPSDIPEAPMLKQEKVPKPTFVNNPLSASADFSSSPRISTHLTLFIVSACLSILSH